MQVSIHRYANTDPFQYDKKSDGGPYALVESEGKLVWGLPQGGDYCEVPKHDKLGLDHWSIPDNVTHLIIAIDADGKTGVLAYMKCCDEGAVS